MPRLYVRAVLTLLLMVPTAGHANRYLTEGGGGGGALDLFGVVLILLSVAFVYHKVYRWFSVGGVEPAWYDGRDFLLTLFLKYLAVGAMSFPLMFVVAEILGRGGQVLIAVPIAAAILALIDSKRFSDLDARRAQGSAADR